MRAKLKRFLTSWLPVSSNRRGSCTNCGACCQLPFPCTFLKYRENGDSYCAIYAVRPPSCRKYPRTASEFITTEICGYRFEETPESGRNAAVVSLQQMTNALRSALLPDIDRDGGRENCK